MEGKYFFKGACVVIVIVLCSGIKLEGNVLLQHNLYWAGDEKKCIKLFREKFLKKHLSSVEYSFTEPNIEDLPAVPYFPLATLSSAKRRLALRSWLRTYS